VDDQADQLPGFARKLEALGYDAVQKHFIGWADADDVIREAMKPANRIDGVLTDLMWKGNPYGAQIASGLQSMHFNGVIAVQSNELNPDVDHMLKAQNMLGLFKKGDWDKIDQALKQALQARDAGIV